MRSGDGKEVRSHNCKFIFLIIIINLLLGMSYNRLRFQPYFCGQTDECQVLNSRWALETAKRNVELWYPIVGALEKLRPTLVLLEHKMPHFFRGVTQMYDEDLKGNLVPVHEPAMHVTPYYV